MAEGSKYLVVLITVHFSGFILLRILNRVNSLPWRCGKERIANVPNTGPAQDDYLRRNEIGRERKRRAIRLDAAIWSVAVNFSEVGRDPRGPERFPCCLAYCIRSSADPADRTR